MAPSLVYQSIIVLHVEVTRLLAQVNEIMCKKTRRKTMRRMIGTEPIIRYWRIILAASGHEIGYPKQLNEDECLLQYACVGWKTDLTKFKEEVLDPERRDFRTNRRYVQFSNADYHHPECYPYPDTILDIQREIEFRYSEEYLEMGKTYAWYLHRYDEVPSFISILTHGNCEVCNRGLPVWRDCYYCAEAYFLDNCDDIYVRSMECSRYRHQESLKDVTKCHECGGPPEIEVVPNPYQDIGVIYWSDSEWNE